MGVTTGHSKKRRAREERHEEGLEEGGSGEEGVRDLGTSRRGSSCRWGLESVARVPGAVDLGNVARFS